MHVVKHKKWQSSVLSRDFHMDYFSKKLVSVRLKNKTSYSSRTAWVNDESIMGYPFKSIYLKVNVHIEASYRVWNRSTHAPI